MDVEADKFCRLCLRLNVELNDIFDKKDNSEQNNVSNYINLFFAVEVTKSDPYSTHVCKNCSDIIVTMCKYRLQFRKNDVLLRNKKFQMNLKAKFKVTPRPHESVKKIFVKYKQIKLDHDLWGLDFNPKLIVHKL